MKTQIINFMGAPGVGKTTLAEQVSRETGIYFFQREAVLDSIFGTERDTPAYNHLAGSITKAMYELATVNARLGVSSITEAPMKPAIQGQRAGFLDTMLEAGKQHGFKVAAIYCTAPADTVLAYLQQRGAARDEPKYDPHNQETGWPWFLKTFIDVPGPTLYEHLRVDTTTPVNENVKQILTYLHRS